MRLPIPATPPLHYVVLLTAFALVVSFYSYSQQRLEQAQIRHLFIQHQLSMAQATLAGIRADDRLPAYAALYRQLQLHVIDAQPPDLTAWLESIRPFTQQLDYELLPARPLPPRSGLTPTFYPFRIRMAVLHELRLFDLFAHLRSQGWLWLEHCTIAPREEAAYLAAECEGGWLTLKTS